MPESDGRKTRQAASLEPGRMERQTGPNGKREIDLPATRVMLPGMDRQELAELLKKRRTVIADHSWRDREPDQHLEALKDVSEAIAAWHHRHRGQLPGRLDHFLTSCSFDKALAFLEADAGDPAR